MGILVRLSCENFKRNVFTISDKTDSHKGDVVLDPFMGSGTCGVVCIQTGRKFIGIEKNKEFFKMAVARIKKLGINNLQLWHLIKLIKILFRLYLKPKEK